MKYFLLTFVFLVSLPAYAQQTGSVQDFFVQLLPILRNVFILFIAVAFLVFFWGIAKFILHSGDEKAVEQGKRLMVWGVISLFVMVAIVGIISFLQDMFLGGAVPGYIIRTNSNP